jgi:hypothetical protein
VTSWFPVHTYQSFGNSYHLHQELSYIIATYVDWKSHQNIGSYLLDYKAAHNLKDYYWPISVDHYLSSSSQSQEKMSMAATLSPEEYYENITLTNSAHFPPFRGLKWVSLRSLTSRHVIIFLPQEIAVQFMALWCCIVARSSGQFGCRSTCSNARKWRESDTFTQHGNFKFLSFLLIQRK